MARYDSPRPNMTDAAANQIASAKLLFCISAGRTAAFTSSDENWARDLAPTWKYQACSPLLLRMSLPLVLSFRRYRLRSIVCDTMECEFPVGSFSLSQSCPCWTGGMGRGAWGSIAMAGHRRQHYVRRDVMTNSPKRTGPGLSGASAIQVLIKGRVHLSESTDCTSPGADRTCMAVSLNTVFLLLSWWYGLGVPLLLMAPQVSQQRWIRWLHCPSSPPQIQSSMICPRHD